MLMDEETEQLPEVDLHLGRTAGMRRSIGIRDALLPCRRGRAFRLLRGFRLTIGPEGLDIVIRKPLAAFVFRIDGKDDILHGVAPEELTRLRDRSIEGELSGMLTVLCEDDDLIEEIDDTVRRMGDHHDDLLLIRDLPKLLHEITCHDTVETGIRLVEHEETWV